MRGFNWEFRHCIIFLSNYYSSTQFCSFRLGSGGIFQIQFKKTKDSDKLSCDDVYTERNLNLLINNDANNGVFPSRIPKIFFIYDIGCVVDFTSSFTFGYEQFQPFDISLSYISWGEFKFLKRL